MLMETVDTRATESGQRADTSALRVERRIAVVEGRRRTLRLSDSAYLVQWHPSTSLWCVVNMAGLDEHAARCSAFRWRRNCEHLSLIHELCAREAAATGAAGLP
jgi:hypothetical protein